MIEEIKAIGEVIASLGEAGMAAFIWWIVADLAKTAIVYGAGFGAVTYVANRIARGISSARSA